MSALGYIECSVKRAHWSGRLLLAGVKGVGVWGGAVIHVLPSVSRAFRRSTRTPLRCDVQSPSSRGNLCPLSCGWGRAHWPCC